MAYAQKGESAVAKWNGDKDLEILSFKAEPYPKMNDKKSFLENLKKGDSIYTEAGSGNDKICLAAAKVGANIYRIPADVLVNAGATPKMSRKERVCVITRIAQDEPSKFYSMRIDDENVTQLRILIDAYEAIQRGIRIPVQLRLQGVYRDLDLIGHEAFKTKVREEFSPGQVFAQSMCFENAIVAEIKKILRMIPIYKKLFENIYGVGPLIAARFIARIADIRRFSTKGKLKAYAGYHVDVNGQCPKRKKGEFASWCPGLKQACFLWIDQVNRHKPEDDPWKAMLVARKVYERKKFPEPIKENGKILYSDAHIQTKAYRYTIQKFLEWLWREWRQFEGLQGN